MSELKEFVEDCDRIKLKKFFQFRPVDPSSDLAHLPGDYRDFLQNFGEVDLFRDPVNPWHCLYVYAPMKDLANGATKVVVGRQFDLGDAFLTQNGDDWQVTSIRPGARTSKSWKSFTDWFVAAYRKSKKTFSKADWEKALQPAPPFTEEVQRIAEARRKFSVSLVGVNGPNSVRLRVVNNSDQTLMRFTFGMRMPRGGDGWSSVPTSDIGPGQSGDVTRETYHSGDLEKLEVYELLDPQPEDRNYYFEFDAATAVDLPSSTPETSEERPSDKNDPGADRSTEDPRFGDWKFSHEVTLTDLLQHPIWLWCLDLSTDEDGEDGPIGGDESSMRPWLDGDDVELEMDSPTILLRVDGTDKYAKGVYSALDESVEGLCVFWAGEWIKAENLAVLGPLRRYTAIPSILGDKNCQFISDGADLSMARLMSNED